MFPILIFTRCSIYYNFEQEELAARKARFRLRSCDWQWFVASGSRGAADVALGVHKGAGFTGGVSTSGLLITGVSFHAGHMVRMTWRRAPTRAAGSGGRIRDSGAL